MNIFCQRLLRASLPFLFIFGLSACEEAKPLTEAQKLSQQNRQFAKQDFKAFITEQFESYSKANLPISYYNKNNAVLKLNQIETTSPDLITAQTTLYNNNTPMLDLEYQFKPSNEIIDSVQTVVTYQVIITREYGNDFFFKKIFGDLKPMLTGLISDTGEYYETLTYTNEFNDFNFVITPSTIKYHRNADASDLSWIFIIPKMIYQSNNEQIEAEGITYTTNNNELFQFTSIYTGGYILEVEHLTFNSPDSLKMEFEPIRWEQSVIQDINSSYLTFNHSTAFKGTIVSDKTYNITVSGTSCIEQIDPQLIELASNYQMAMAFIIFYQEKFIQDIGRQMITAGTKIELKDLSVTVNGEPLKANLHFSFDEPDDIEINHINQLSELFKLFNANVDIGLSYQFLTETLEMDHQETTQILSAFKDELNRYNLAAILNDDGKNIHLKFEIKQGDFYVDNVKLNTTMPF